MFIIIKLRNKLSFFDKYVKKNTAWSRDQIQLVRKGLMEDLVTWVPGNDNTRTQKSCSHDLDSAFVTRGCFREMTYLQYI